MTFDYSECENLTPSTTNGTYTFTTLPSDKYSYNLRSKDSSATPSAPQYALLDNTNNVSVTDPLAKKQCILEFNVPANMQHSVFLYYKLTNFFQNHRRYVKSLDSDQLKGKFVSPHDLDNSDCKPLGSRGGKAIYPCGLIANSLFNGRLFSDDPTRLMFAKTRSPLHYSLDLTTIRSMSLLPLVLRGQEKKTNMSRHP